MTRTFYLTNQDFATGSYLVDKPGIYRLKETINFNPNPDKDWRPDPYDTRYQSPAFSLGFFAAIVIRCNDVCIDLNGFTIKQHPDFYLQQRFYANIELGEDTFQPRHGPQNLDTVIDGSDNIFITNGTLGLSSHHGIHGNIVKHCIFKNLIIEDFEVGAIAFNKHQYVYFRDIQIKGTNTDVPITGFYSQGRFMIPPLNALIKKATENSNQVALDELQPALVNLKAKLDEVFNQVKNGQTITDPLYRNESRLPDGSLAFGINLKSAFTVNDVLPKSDTQKKGVYIHDVKIENIKVNAININAINDGTASIIGGIGAVIDVDRIRQPIYVPDELLISQALLAKWGEVYGMRFGNNMPLVLVNAILGVSGTIESVINSRLKSGEWKVIYGGDVMHHLNKGIFGVFLDGGKEICLKNVNISKCHNFSQQISDIVEIYDCPYVTSLPHEGHVRDGYLGCDVFGIFLNNCCKTFLSEILIDDIISERGPVVGICYYDGNKLSYVEKLAIGKLNAGSENVDSPNKRPVAIGLKINRNNEVDYKKVIKLTEGSGYDGYYFIVLQNDSN